MSKTPHLRGCARGIGFSLEAGLASVLLFAVVISALQLAAVSSRPQHEFDQLSFSSYGLANEGARNGAWLSAVPPSLDDTRAKNFAATLPTSICASVEIFRYGVVPQNLTWAYLLPGCGSPGFGQQSTSIVPFVARQGASSHVLYYARITTWAK